MTEIGEQDSQVRRFLLGELEEDERDRVEEALMLSAGYREQILIAEEILIEDYLDGVLSTDERKAFETHFVATTRQRRRVSIARVLRTYDSQKVTDVDQPQPAPPIKRRLITRELKNRPFVFTSVAAGVLLIIAFGILQGVLLWRTNSEQIESTRQRSGIERELAQLNSAPVQASTYVLLLAPVSLRDTNEASTLSIPGPTEIIEIRLILSGAALANYTVELSKVDTTNRYRIDGLHAQSTENGQAVTVRLPIRLLSSGDYRLSLSGRSADGGNTNAGEYNFQVRSR